MEETLVYGGPGADFDVWWEVGTRNFTIMEDGCVIERFKAYAIPKDEARAPRVAAGCMKIFESEDV